MKSLITFVACLVLPSSIVRSAEPAANDFDAFVSPVIFAGDMRFAYRDPAVTYHDGKYIMFFHGSYPEAKQVETGHGAASLAFAWSDDLVHWKWPGQKTRRDDQ